MNRYIYFVLVSVFSLSLSSCKTVGTTSTSLSLDNYHAGKDGILVGAFRNHSGDFNRDLPWQGLVVKMISTENPSNTSLIGKRYNFNNVLEGKNHSLSLFSGTLPEGNYRLDKLQFSIGVSTHWVDFSKTAEFSIQKNVVTDIGESIVNLVSGYYSYELVNTGNPKAVEGYFKKHLLNQYQIMNNLTWKRTSPIRSSDTNKIMNSIKAAAKDINGNYFDFEQKLIAGSNLGQVLVRTKEGKWTNIDTGGLSTIYAVDGSDDSGIIAGGELNYLVIVNKEQEIIKISTKGLLRGTIRFVYMSQKFGLIIAIKGLNETVFYTTYEIENPKWIKRAAFSGGDNVEDWKRLSSIILHGPYVYILSSGELNRALVENLEFKKLPNAGNVVSLTNTPSGMLVGRIAYSRGYSYSNDNGDSWRTIKGDKKDGHIIFISEKKGYMQTSSIFNHTHSEIYETDDGGNSWKKIADPNFIIGGFICSSKCEQMLFTGLKGKVFSSIDKGKTWNLERNGYRTFTN